MISVQVSLLQLFLISVSPGCNDARLIFQNSSLSPCRVALSFSLYIWVRYSRLQTKDSTFITQFLRAFGVKENGSQEMQGLSYWLEADLHIHLSNAPKAPMLLHVHPTQYPGSSFRSLHFSSIINALQGAERPAPWIAIPLKYGHYVWKGDFQQVTHMPPELLKENRLSKAADVYAFGVMLWELYTGDNMDSLVHEHLKSRWLAARAAHPNCIDW